MSCNLGASNSWNPQDLSRPVHGLLYPLEFEEHVPDFISEYCALYRYCAVQKLNIKLCETMNLFFALYGFETRYFTLSIEDGLGLFDNM